MAKRLIKVLLLADTHLGFDLPYRPRVQRRRRGPDFFANTERALLPAREGEVDLVVHGGDLLYRSRVPPQLVQEAMAPLFGVADQGIPVFVVPGNHERSQIPFPLLARHPRVHIFDRPRTIVLDEIRGCTVALCGWPYHRRMSAGGFSARLEETGWRGHPAEIRLLCLHQAVQGARVGIQNSGSSRPFGALRVSRNSGSSRPFGALRVSRNYCFRHGVEVIPGRAIPGGFAAVLAGHIHRHQVLTRDLITGRPLAAPVLYPGSVERTSFVEREEPKGYLVLELAPTREGGALVGWSFRRLPARPMVVLEVPRSLASRANGEALQTWLRHRLAELDPDAVVRVDLPRSWPPTASLPSASELRSLAPRTMNVTLRCVQPQDRRAASP